MIESFVTDMIYEIWSFSSDLAKISLTFHAIMKVQASVIKGCFFGRNELENESNLRAEVPIPLKVEKKKIVYYFNQNILRFFLNQAVLASQT